MMYLIHMYEFSIVSINCRYHDGFFLTLKNATSWSQYI